MTTIVAYRGLGCRDATKVFFATASEADGVRVVRADGTVRQRQRDDAFVAGLTQKYGYLRVAKAMEIARDSDLMGLAKLIADGVRL